MRLLPFVCAGAVALVAAAATGHVVDGINFDELDLGNGAHLHNGHYAHTDQEIVTNLQDLYPGFVGGKRVVVVRFHYDIPATGYDEDAKAYLVASGRATHLADLGAFSLFEDGGPYPDRWLYVSFSGGKLYTDVWHVEDRCKGTRDWTASTYDLRNGKLARIYRQKHHRSGVPVACAEPPYMTPSPDEVYHNAALAYDEKAQYAQAAAEWSKALNLEGAQPDSDTLLARASDYLLLGRYSDALADYNAAAKNTSDYWLYWGRARVYVYTGKPELALADLNAAIAQNTKSTAPEYAGRALEERGALCFAQRRFSDAAKDFEAANALNPTVGNMLFYNLALARAGQEDPSRFGKLLATAGESQWPACAVHFFNGENDILRQAQPEARREFQEAQTTCDLWDAKRFISEGELRND